MANVEHYRKQARRLQRAVAAGDPDALIRAGGGARFLLTDAQHVIAREHGYPSWGDFVRAIEAPPRPLARIGSGAAGDPVQPLAYYEARAEQHGEAAVAREYGYPTWHDLVRAVQREQRAAAGPRDPLHEIARRGDVDAARALIAAGAEVDTPLLIAACFDHVALVELLLDNGANETTDAVWGVTPLVMALYHGARNAADALAKRRVIPRAFWVLAALGHAAHNGRAAAVASLLRRGADPNFIHFGMTPLHFAVSQQHDDVSTILRASGADTSIRDAEQNATPDQWRHYLDRG